MYDEETGLYYLNARYYDPVIGRFINEDTYLGDPTDPLSLNLYTYAQNNPLKYYDPTGHWVETAFDVASLAWSIYDVVQDHKNYVNWIGLGLDVIDVAVPFLGGLGESYRSMKITGNIFNGFVDAVVKQLDDEAYRVGRIIAEEAAEKTAKKLAEEAAEKLAKEEAEHLARKAATEKAEKEAAQKLAREAEEKALKEAEEKAIREAEEKATREAQEKARKEADDQLKGGKNPENKSKDIVDNQQKNAKDKLNDKGVEYNGKSVKQNNDLFDPNRIDEQGRTNIERMKQGLAPKGHDGKPVNVHHINQTNNGPLTEISASQHQQGFGNLHKNTGQSPSQINRGEFNSWRNSYWKWRANDFN